MSCSRIELFLHNLDNFVEFLVVQQGLLVEHVAPKVVVTFLDLWVLLPYQQFIIFACESPNYLIYGHVHQVIRNVLHVCDALNDVLEVLARNVDTLSQTILSFVNNVDELWAFVQLFERSLTTISQLAVGTETFDQVTEILNEQCCHPLIISLSALFKEEIQDGCDGLVLSQTDFSNLLSCPL